MAELLLEIGTEEIPSGYIMDGLRSLKEITEARLTEARLSFGDGLETYGTPRRLVLIGRDVAPRQPDAVEEVTGPPVKAAYDDQGNPTRAAEGFARKQGVSIQDLGSIDTPRGPYVFVRKEIPGLPAGEVLARIFPEVVRDIPWPKSMRWGGVGFLFVRPIHWIVAVLGGETIPFEVAGVQSGNQSRGHRFMAPDPFTVTGVDDYLEKAAKARVMVDPREREAEVGRIVRDAAARVGGEVVLDPDLLSTVANLVEYPTAVCGGFDPDFLALPDPVLITPMAEHQRYFAVRNAQGRLMPHFVAVNNTLARDDRVVQKGHERVLRARLSDAAFFFQEDRKRPLLERLEDLKAVIYQAELGTSHEKVERFVSIAEAIATEVAPDRLDHVRLACRLAKCDLVTEMVSEFASLQGIMGEAYALLDGHPQEVAMAIREHYMPVRAGSDLPETVTGATVGIADRLDTIAGCFAIGQEPTGAADPFALRRHALAILRILEDRAWKVSLKALVEQALKGISAKAAFDREAMEDRIMAFFKDRFRNRLVQEGRLPEAVDAVLAARFDRIPELRPGIEGLERFVQSSSDVESLALTFKRVRNILKDQGPSPDVDPGLFQDKSERDLWEAFTAMEGDVLRELDGGNDYEALTRMAALRRPVDDFFEGVEVLTKEDPRLRRNRVGVLQRVSGLFMRVADFSRLAV